MRNSPFPKQLGYIYAMIFLIWEPFGLYTIQRPWYLGKITLLSIWYSDCIDPNNDSGIQDYFILSYPPSINI